MFLELLLFHFFIIFFLLEDFFGIKILLSVTISHKNYFERKQLLKTEYNLVPSYILA